MKKDLIVHQSPKHPVSESVRLLRTNLSFLCRNKKNKVILMTSTAPGEGKSWTAANLAIAFAQSNQKVLLVDADLRKGRQHKIFGRLNSVGFSEYLQNVDLAEGDIEKEAEILMKSIEVTEVPNLFLIPSGPVPFNPSELLETSNIDDFLAIVKNSFDVVIFDAPPVSIVTDALLLCKKVDYVAIVAAVGETKKDMLANTKKSIENVGGKIAGVVLNKMPADKRKEYTKYYSKYSDTEDLGKIREAAKQEEKPQLKVNEEEKVAKEEVAVEEKKEEAKTTKKASTTKKSATTKKASTTTKAKTAATKKAPAKKAAAKKGDTND